MAFSPETSATDRHPSEPSNDSFWPGRAVLVTGGTGLLGQALIAQLVRRGAHVVGLSRRPAALVEQTTPAHSQMRWAQVSLTELEPLQQIIQTSRIDTIFHLAGQSIVGAATRTPHATFESNLRGTWNILEAARTSRDTVSRVVIASSAACYDPAATIPYREETPLQSTRPYDTSKQCAELLAQSYAATYDLPLAVTRCAHLYGPGDLNFDRLIPSTIRAALDRQQPHLRGDGSPTHDFLYVHDAAIAYLRLAERLQQSDIRSQAFNLGPDRPAKVLDVVETILKLTGAESLTPILERQTGESRSIQLNSDKARSLLNWQPTYSLESGLAETIPWYRAWHDQTSTSHAVRE
jgi:CDP-glucose 4,6-dehydratase